MKLFGLLSSITVATFGLRECLLTPFPLGRVCWGVFVLLSLLIGAWFWRGNQLTITLGHAEEPAAQVPDPARTWDAHNLNDQVRFKMTDAGRAFLAKNTDPPWIFQPDADGWCQTELWHFASIFGSSFSVNSALTVETSIQIRSIS